MKKTFFFKFRVLIFTLYGCGLIGCTTTGVVIPENPNTVGDIRKAFVSTFGEPRLISSNGRELFTKYHEADFIELEPDMKIKSRYYTKVIILGERRPYDISVDVIKEKKVQNKFEIEGHVESLSAKQAERLKETLDKSRVEPKSIDDFTPF